MPGHCSNAYKSGIHTFPLSFMVCSRVLTSACAQIRLLSSACFGLVTFEMMRIIGQSKASKEIQCINNLKIVILAHEYIISTNENCSPKEKCIRHWMTVSEFRKSSRIFRDFLPKYISSGTSVNYISKMAAPCEIPGG